VAIEPPSPSGFADEHQVKIVANDLSNRFINLIDHADYLEQKTWKEPEKLPTHQVTGVAYHADTGNDTIDLIGEPAIKSYFQAMKSDRRDPSPKPISTGMDFHKTYVAPVVVQSPTSIKPQSIQLHKTPDQPPKKFHPIKAYNSKMKDSQTVVIGEDRLSPN